MKPKIVVAYGTRPEKIKLTSVISALRAEGVDVVEWCSGQSRDFMKLTYEAMRPDGTLESLIANILKWFPEYFDGASAVVVQGDTATAYGCALAAWLRGVPVAHVEAGLRTYQHEPFPEEGFRRMIAAMARWHFCPDRDAALNVLHEQGYHHTNAQDWEAFDDEVQNYLFATGVHVVGNTVIDTLPREPFRVLVTLHRRENWGERITNALGVLREFADKNAGVQVKVVEHPNWDVWAGWLPEAGSGPDDNWLCYVDPKEHDEMLDEIRMADLIVTDSGGLQEEAAHFGVPCLVLRKATERKALEQLGAVRLIDPDEPNALPSALRQELAKRRAYGNGTAGKKIARILMEELRRGED